MGGKVYGHRSVEDDGSVVVPVFAGNDGSEDFAVGFTGELEFAVYDGGAVERLAFAVGKVCHFCSLRCGSAHFVLLRQGREGGYGQRRQGE